MSEKRRSLPRYNDISVVNDTLGGVDAVVKAAQRVFEQANHDTLLSELLNRNALEQYITQWANNHDPHSAFYLAVVDLNDFKRVNDLHGHLVGNEVLADVAKIMTDSFRRKDEIVARVGGDEFVIFLPVEEATDLQEREPLSAEAVQRYILATLYEARDEKVLESIEATAIAEVGFSVGVKRYLAIDTAGVPLDELLAGPDALMYEDKTRQKQQLESKVEPAVQ